jgi:septum formation protein
MTHSRPIILASASPRRRELLTQIGITFTVHTADIDETPHPNENPVKYTLRLAEAKARAVLAHHPDAIIIGADTTVIIEGQILGKPRDDADAERMLTLLQDNRHQVTTGIAVLTSTETRIAAETTGVTFAPMDPATIRAYIATGEPTGKAGAYAIQGIAAQWIPRIEGDYSNVVGLPLARLATILNHLKP